MKNKTYTEEEKQHIIAFAKEHGITSVKKEFNIWPDTVKYWMDPMLREKVKANVQKYDVAKKSNTDTTTKKAEYQKQRIESGAAKEYFSNRDIDKKLETTSKIKQHRLDNMEHYKELAHQRYLKAKAKKEPKQLILPANLDAFI